MKKIFGVFVVFAIVGVFLVPTQIKAEETPWFINDSSFAGNEEMDPSTYSPEEVYGKEYETANTVLSGNGTVSQVSHFQNVRLMSYILNPFVIIAFLGTIGVFTKRKEIKRNTQIQRERNVLEERRVSLEEEKFKNGIVSNSPKSKSAGAAATDFNFENEDGFSTSGFTSGVITNAFVPGDVNGDGIVNDSDLSDLSIPFK